MAATSEGVIRKRALRVLHRDLPDYALLGDLNDSSRPASLHQGHAGELLGSWWRRSRTSTCSSSLGR
jgi:hypothetical protein